MTETVTIFGFATNCVGTKKCPRIKDQPGTKKSQKLLSFFFICHFLLIKTTGFPKLALEVLYLSFSQIYGNWNFFTAEIDFSE